MAIRNNIENKGIAYGQWEMVEQTFATPNFDVVIPHTLPAKQPWYVRYEVVDATAAGVLYRGDRPAGNGYLVLKSSAAGTYRIRLFIEARDAEVTVPLPGTA